MSMIRVNCPYCEAPESIAQPEDFAPRYRACAACGKRYILEPVASGLNAYRDGEAPCCSDPECRDLEMSLGDD